MCEGTEGFGTGDEIRLAIYLYHYAHPAISVGVQLDDAFRSIPVCAFRCLGQAFLTQIVHCLVEVAIRLLQRRPAVENADACRLAQLFDLFSRDRHD